MDDRCFTCDGEGVWCGKHDCPEGCDCEDDAPRIPCEDCGGTGISNEGTSEEE